jgi:hypothetical protein
MRTVHYRPAEESDVPAMARIRAAEWETEDYWRDRISRYMNRELHPQQALMPRVSYVAAEGETLVGFIAGHLTRRFACAPPTAVVLKSANSRLTGLPENDPFPDCRSADCLSA